MYFSFLKNVVRLDVLCDRDCPNAHNFQRASEIFPCKDRDLKFSPLYLIPPVFSAKIIGRAQNSRYLFCAIARGLNAFKLLRLLQTNHSPIFAHKEILHRGPGPGLCYNLMSVVEKYVDMKGSPSTKQVCADQPISNQFNNFFTIR